MDIINNALRFIMEGAYSMTGDYGVAIVMITILIKFLIIPLNIKQRKGMKQQQELNVKAQELKEMYKNNEKKLQEETQKLFAGNSGAGFGCLVSFLQIPILICLNNVIRATVAVGSASILLPWVSSLLLKDATFILPLLSTIVQLAPQLMPYMKFFKVLKLQKPNRSMVLMIIVMNGMISFTLPSGVGLYYLTSGLFHTCEQTILNIISVWKYRQQSGIA